MAVAPDRSVKRLAWAFGVAKRNTVEESDAYRALVAKVAESRHFEPAETKCECGGPLECRSCAHGC